MTPDQPVPTTGHRRRWALPAAALAVVIGAVLAACLTPQNAKETPAMPDDHPSMETVQARYEEMRTTAVSRLDAELGAHAWEESVTSTGSRARCSDHPEAETLTLPLLRFDGTYPEADWQRSVEIVTEVTAEYGFTTRTAIDRAGDVEIIGEDAYGAQYSYGMATNTILGLSTGCHVWDSAPE